MSLGSEGRTWDELAGLDPLWAVLSHPERRHGGWDRSEFLATGEAEIAEMLGAATHIGYPLQFRRALDFGSGVGRLTRALSRHFDEAVGVDVSPRMVALAREINADRDGCTFVVNADPDLRQFPDRSFDLVYSSLVLQHLPSAALAVRYLAEFLRVVRADGLVVFQAPYRVDLRHRLQLRRRVWVALDRLGVRPPFLYARMGLHPIRMTALPKERVERVVVEARGTIALVTEEPAAPGYAASRYYVHLLPDSPGAPAELSHP